MTSCLVVDDSRVVRMVARKILEGLDFEIREAEDGKSALGLCLADMPDAILLDWKMPAMTGLDFLRTLRKTPAVAQPVVIVCSVYNDAAHIAEASGAGADEYIMKPFDSDILRSKLNQVGLL
ncbi:MAG: response regulator [Rhodospirillaceae bacterium]|nr:response regulator [Rhodospirillaceae bacterium]